MRIASQLNFFLAFIFIFFRLHFSIKRNLINNPLDQTLVLTSNGAVEMKDEWRGSIETTGACAHPEC